jgi:hypothetical protein
MNKKIITLIGMGCITGGVCLYEYIKSKIARDNKLGVDVLESFGIDIDEYLNNPNYVIPEEIMEKINEESKRRNNGKGIIK